MYLVCVLHCMYLKAAGSSPFQGFRTKDGHIVVAAGNDKQFVKVCQVSRFTNTECFILHLHIVSVFKMKYSHSHVHMLADINIYIQQYYF